MRSAFWHRSLLARSGATVSESGRARPRRAAWAASAHSAWSSAGAEWVSSTRRGTKSSAARLEGRGLRELLAEGFGAQSRPVPVAWSLDVLAGLAAAVDYIHERCLLHGDLKSASVFLCEPFSGGASVKLLDFGLAAPRPLAVDSGGIPVRRNIAAGTPAYFAPEVALGAEPAPASDLHSFAVVANELLSGTLPFSGDVESVLRKLVEDEPPRPSAVNPSLPEELSDVLLDALARHPADRPASARDLVEDLRAAWNEARSREQREKVRAFLTRHRPRRAVLALLLGAASSVLRFLARERSALGIDGFAKGSSCGCRRRLFAHP